MNLMGIGSNTQKIVLGAVILLAIIVDKAKKGEIEIFKNLLSWKKTQSNI